MAFLKLDPFVEKDPERRIKATDQFSSLLFQTEIVKARVYSIVENRVRLTLINAENPLFEYDIALELIKIGIFDKCDEPLISKVLKSKPYRI